MKEFLKKNQMSSSPKEAKKANTILAAGKPFSSLSNLSTLLADRFALMDEFCLPFYESFALDREDRRNLSSLFSDVAWNYSAPLTEAVIIFTNHFGLFTSLMRKSWSGSCLLFDNRRLHYQEHAIKFCKDTREYAGKLIHVSELLADVDTFPELTIVKDGGDLVLIDATNSRERERFAEPKELLINISATIRAYRELEFKFVDAVYHIVQADSREIQAGVKSMRESFLADWSDLIHKWSLVDEPLRSETILSGR